MAKPTKIEIILSVYDTPLGTDIGISTILSESIHYHHKLSYTYGRVIKVTTPIDDDIEGRQVYKWNLPYELARAVPNGTKGTVTITCETYDSTWNLIGSDSVDVQFVVPESIKPTLTVTVSDPRGYAATYGGYVKNKSKLNISVKASALYGAKIVSTVIDALGVSTTVNPYTSNVINLPAGTYPVSVIVMDSRGMSNDYQANITVLDYAEPVISTLKVWRTNAQGKQDDSGGYAKITYDASISPIKNKNTKLFRLEYKRADQTEWTEITRYSAGYKWQGSTIFEADTEYIYQFRLRASDAFYISEKVISLSSARTILDFNVNGKGVAIGMVSSDNSDDLEVGLQLKAYNGIMAPDGIYPKFQVREMGTFSNTKTQEEFTDMEIANQGWYCIGFVMANKVISSNASYISSWHWDSNTGTLSIVKTSADVYKDTKCRAILFNIS